MSRVRGVRGATTADDNTKEAVLSATMDLLQEMVRENKINPDDLACAFFTVTPDLTAAFPAEVARVRMGWTNVAFMSAIEIPVPDAPIRCIRVLLLVNTERASSDMWYVYQKGAAGLRSRGIDNGNAPGGFTAR